MSVNTPVVQQTSHLHRDLRRACEQPVCCSVVGRDDDGQAIRHPHTKFEGEVYVLTKDEGGRHSPFFSNYRPQFYFRTTASPACRRLQPGHA